MIVKTLTRKGGIKQLLTYIFRESKMLGFEESLDLLPKLNSKIYIPKWLKADKKDIQYLKIEKGDRKLWQEFKAKAPDGDIQKFVQNYLLPKHESLTFTHNIKSKSLDGFIKEFQENESRRLHPRSNNTQIVHNILSFSKHDTPKMNTEILLDFANKFAELRSQNCLYAGAIHQDKEFFHIHLAQSGVQLNGKSSRISKQEFSELKQALQTYQIEKYPELNNSLPKHPKGNHPKVIFKKYERATDRNNLLRCLDETYAKARSKEDFIERLSKLGHAVYYRSGKLQGALDENGNKHRLKNLGYDDKKFADLENRTRIEERELAELQDIRSERNQDVDREVEDNERNRSEDEENQEMEDDDKSNHSNVNEEEQTEDDEEEND